MYRIKHVEVYVTAATDEANPGLPQEPINFSVMASVDLDDANTPTFESIRTRPNLNLVSLTNSLPTQVVGSFQPRANYINQLNASTPSNAIPSPNTWFDTAANSQQWIGLKVHVATPSSRNHRIQVFAKLTIEFKGQT